MDTSQTVFLLTMIFPGFLFALCFHEFAHGWMAKRCGDNTAELMGRLTLNPIAHMDPIGTVALPLLSIFSGIPIFFGWAKPVPVNIRNLQKPKEDMFWIALAGPLANIILALISVPILAYVIRSGAPMDSAPTQFLFNFMGINVVLAIFNLFPLHPLDGGKILARFLPIEINRYLESLHPMLTFGVLILLIYTGVFSVLIQLGMIPFQQLLQVFL